MAGAAQPQQEHAILLIKVYDLHSSSVRRDVRTKGVESLLYAIYGVHSSPEEEFLH